MLEIKEKPLVNLPNTPAPMNAQHQAEMVLGECCGWPLAPIIDWLVSKDSRFTDPSLFLGGLIRQLLNAGAQVNRVRLSFMTIHPQVAAFSFIWEKGMEGVKPLQIGHGFMDSPAFIGSPAEELFETKSIVRYRIKDIDVSDKHETLHDVKATGATDYIGLPLETSMGDIHTLFLSTDAPDGFNDADIAKFERLGGHIQAKVELLATQIITSALLNTYLGERTGSKVLNGQIMRGDGEVIEAALWFSDLRDFTLHTETLPDDQLLELLNQYFELVYDAVSNNGGEVLRFIGDAMLVVFTAENAGNGCLYQASEATFKASEEAYAALDKLNIERKSKNKVPIDFGVGLHEGKVTYGNIGAPNRLDFTVMGPAVNRTARLESMTKQLGRRRLMSREFANKVACNVESLGMHALKGIEAKQEICAIAR